MGRWPGESSVQVRSRSGKAVCFQEEPMRRFRIPWLVDIVLSDDAAEIESLAKNPSLDRAYSDRSLPLNGMILGRVRKVLELDGKPFPTVSPRCRSEERRVVKDGPHS